MLKLFRLMYLYVYITLGYRICILYYIISLPISVFSVLIRNPSENKSALGSNLSNKLISQILT